MGLVSKTRILIVISIWLQVALVVESGRQQQNYINNNNNKNNNNNACNSKFLNRNGGKNGQVSGYCQATCPDDFDCMLSKRSLGNDDDTNNVCLCKDTIGNNTGMVMQDGTKFVARTHCTRDDLYDGVCGRRCYSRRVQSGYRVSYRCTATLYTNAKDIGNSVAPTTEVSYCVCAARQASAYNCTLPMFLNDKGRGKYEGLCAATCPDNFDCKSVVLDDESERDVCICGDKLGGVGEADLVLEDIPLSNSVSAQGIYELDKKNKHYNINVTCQAADPASDAAEFVCQNCTDVDEYKTYPYRCTAYEAKANGKAKDPDSDGILDFCTCSSSNPKSGKGRNENEQQNPDSDPNGPSEFPGILSKLSSALQYVRDLCENK